MAGKQRFLSNKDNVIRAATLVASAIRTATGTARPVPLDREGSGVVRLTGAYTGSVEATFDIEITDSGLGATPQASEPAFVGAGDGAMTAVTVDVSTAAQDFTVTLREAAADERDAEGNADGLRVIASEDVGEDGNGTFLRVDRSPLVFVDSGRIVPELKPAGTIETSGPAWDFGGLPLLSNGRLNADTPAVRFGDDPQVYRQYSIQRNGFTVYRFLPALAREIRVGARVWRCSSGHRKVTVTVGQPTDRFAVVTTPALAGNIRALATDGALGFVGVSDGGEIAFSVDGGVTWDPATSESFSGANNAVCYVEAADRFVAGGASGAMAYSTDGGDNWTSVTSGFGADAIYGLAAGGGKVIAVGVSGKISKSTDNGSTWTLQSSNALSDEDILCVAFLLDHFVAASVDGVTAYSDTTGATWTNFASSPISAGTDGNALAFDADRRRLVLGASSGEVFYSDDLGESWTEATTPHIGDVIKAVTAACGIFAVIDDTGRISTSRDMTTWSAITNAPLDEGTAIVGCADGTFVAADNDEFARAQLAYVHSPIRTRFDFLYSLYVAGFAVSSDTRAAGDMRPGAQATLEFQPITGSFAPYVDRSAASMLELEDLAIGEGAASQEIKIVCTDDTTPGSEEWEITIGTESFTAITAAAYHDATLSFTIPAKSGGGAYAEGDSYTITVLSGAPVVLSGGADAIADNTWSVAGSVSGALADYTQAPTPGTYNDEVGFVIAHGDVPHQVGDQFAFSVEGGKFRWRKDAGSWSAEADIGSAPVSLSDGLSAVFSRGEQPSFADDDIHSFIVRQPYSLDNLRQPNPERFEWPSGSCTVTADLGSAQTIDTLVIGRHTIPEAATITVEGSTNNFSTVAWTETLTWREGLIIKLISTRSQRYIRLTVNQASAIGWWAALPASSVTPSIDPMVLRRVRRKRKGPKTSTFVGRGTAADIVYPGFLSADDGDELEAIINWSDENGDEPFGFVVNVDQPEDAFLVVPDADAFEIVDLYEYQSEDRDARSLSARIPLAAVIE
jgi:photosystem II stability/assembly factor-like uncharacterized protein